MEPVTVNVKRVGERPVPGSAASPGAGPGPAGVGPFAEWFSGPADLETDLRRARTLANWLDSRFSVMGVRFGLDSIVGLIPVVGDTLTALAAAYPIWVAKRHNLGKAVQARMAFNVMVDWLPGLVPVVGDLIDLAYKANLKNLKILEAAIEKKLRNEARGGR